MVWYSDCYMGKPQENHRKMVVLWDLMMIYREFKGILGVNHRKSLLESGVEHHISWELMGFIYPLAMTNDQIYSS